MTNKYNILLTIVLYKQTLWECNTYQTLIKHNPNIPLFIYDNSSQPQHQQSEFTQHTKYTNNPNNPGLSHAYNQAMQHAIKHGCKWMLVLDQDTTFPPDFLDHYTQAIEQTKSEIGIIVPNVRINNNLFMSPTKIKFHISHPSKTKSTGNLCSKKNTAINSGMLINIDIMNQLGGYNEQITLDYSDYQFVNKYSKQYSHFYAMDVECYQEFSNEVQNNTQKLERFKIFCTCIKACEKETLRDKLSFFILVLKRALSLTLQTKQLTPLIILTNKYIKK